MSNSKLVNYTRISPHSSDPRNEPITKITIHHMAGNLTVEQCGEVFQTREASANYGVGTDGRVGLYVDEKNRAWTSDSRVNDNMAVTIEVANDGGAPDWHVSDKALARTVDLVTDICQRNGIKQLVYTGTPEGNLTRHNMFAATLCPGPYLQSKFPWIVDQVNKRLTKKEDDMTEAEVKKIVATEVAKAKKAVLKEVFDISGTGDKPSAWAKDACSWCVKHGVFGGDGDGNYGWQKAITREQAAVIIKNQMEK